MIKKTTNVRGISSSQKIEKSFEKIGRNLERYVEQGDESAIIDIEVNRSTDHKNGDVYEARINFRARHIDVSAHALEPTPHEALDVARREILSTLQNEKKQRIHFARHSALRMKNFFKGLWDREEE